MALLSLLDGLRYGVLVLPFFSLFGKVGCTVMILLERSR